MQAAMALFLNKVSGSFVLTLLNLGATNFVAVEAGASGGLPPVFARLLGKRGMPTAAEQPAVQHAGAPAQQPCFLSHPAAPGTDRLEPCVLQAARVQRMCSRTRGVTTDPRRPAHRSAKQRSVACGSSALRRLRHRLMQSMSHETAGSLLMTCWTAASRERRRQCRLVLQALATTLGSSAWR